MGLIKESYNIQKHIRCYGGLLCFRLHKLFPVTLFTLSRIGTTYTLWIGTYLFVFCLHVLRQKHFADEIKIICYLTLVVRSY